MVNNMQKLLSYGNKIYLESDVVSMCNFMLFWMIRIPQLLIDGQPQALRPTLDRRQPSRSCLLDDGGLISGVQPITSSEVTKYHKFQHVIITCIL